MPNDVFNRCISANPIRNGDAVIMRNNRGLPSGIIDAGINYGTYTESHATGQLYAKLNNRFYGSGVVQYA